MCLSWSCQKNTPVLGHFSADSVRTKNTRIGRWRAKARTYYICCIREIDRKISLLRFTPFDCLLSLLCSPTKDITCLPMNDQMGLWSFFHFPDRLLWNQFFGYHKSLTRSDQRSHQFSGQSHRPSPPDYWESAQSLFFFWLRVGA